MASWGSSQVLWAAGRILPSLTHTALAAPEAVSLWIGVSLCSSRSTCGEQTEPEPSRSPKAPGQSPALQPGTSGSGSFISSKERFCWRLTALLSAAYRDLQMVTNTNWGKTKQLEPVTSWWLDDLRDLFQAKQCYCERSCLWLFHHSKHSSSVCSCKTSQKSPSYITHKI